MIIKSKGFMIKVLFILIIIIVIYNIIDNNRIKVVKENVEVDKLSSSFEGFTILQIGDLHEKSFGKNQKRLLDKINSLDYDMIAITGDMQNKESENMKPFIELLDGIKNKEYMFYVKGNNDSPTYDRDTKQSTPIGKLLEEKGCKFVSYPYPIKKGNDTLWITGLFSTAVINATSKDINPQDVKIALGHIPLEPEFCENITFNDIPDYDLILAGHYHGGQWRIPFYGAIYIPKIYASGLFPKQNEVSGFAQWGNYKQYVTRGLGSSGEQGFLKFRLFNTPELNLITLVKPTNR